MCCAHNETWLKPAVWLRYIVNEFILRASCAGCQLVVWVHSAPEPCLGRNLPFLRLLLLYATSSLRLSKHVSTGNNSRTETKCMTTLQGKLTSCVTICLDVHVGTLVLRAQILHMFCTGSSETSSHFNNLSASVPKYHVGGQFCILHSVFLFREMSLKGCKRRT